MSEKEMIANLISYINNIMDFIDVEDEESVEIVNGGYETLVKPTVNYLYKEQ